MNSRALIGTGAVVAAICCATPMLALLLPVVGLGAWLATGGSGAARHAYGKFGADRLGLHSRRTKAACCEAEIHEESQRS